MKIPFDRVADIYDETRTLPPEVAAQVTEQMLRLSQATPETTFFEPGIGTGRIALPLLERGYAYTGVDISQPMMDKLRQKVAGKPVRLTLVEADATDLPLATGAFDVAIAAHILHLIPDWEKALAEIRRVLKPEGIFIYFHNPTNRTGNPDEISQKWCEILQRYGYDFGFPGAIAEDVLSCLTRQGAALKTVTVATVPQNRSAAELLQTYCDRIYSSLWRIPDTLYFQALQELQTWAAQRFPSLEERLSSDYPIILTAASFC